MLKDISVSRYLVHYHVITCLTSFYKYCEALKEILMEQKKYEQREAHVLIVLDLLLNRLNLEELEDDESKYMITKIAYDLEKDVKKHGIVKNLLENMIYGHATRLFKESYSTTVKEYIMIARVKRVRMNY